MAFICPQESLLGPFCRDLLTLLVLGSFSGYVGLADGYDGRFAVRFD